MSDPQFVRLGPQASHGSFCDVGGSGWSISGKAVKPFPPDGETEARRFVRREVKAGRLVPASRAEYDESLEGDEPLPTGKLPHQEHQVQSDLAKLVQEANEPGTPDSEASNSSEDQDAKSEKKSKSKGKSKKDKKDKKPKDEKEPASSGGAEPELLTRVFLEEQGAPELKALLKSNDLKVEGNFSKAKAVEALIEGKAVQK